MRPIALLQSLRHIAVRRWQNAELQLRDAFGHALLRPEVRPHDLAELAGGIGLDGDRVVIAGTGRYVGQVDALAVHVVLPAVIDAADTAVFVAAEEKVRAAVRAVRLDQPYPAFRVAKGDQVLAHQFDADRRAVGLGNFTRERNRLPEAPEILAHRSAGIRAGEQLVVGGR